MPLLLSLIVCVVIGFYLWRIASRYYSLPCPSWLHWLVELDNPFAKVSQAKTIIEHLNLQPDMTVLDAGCGAGRVTIPLAEKVGTQGQVTALDIQAEMLAIVKEKAQAKNLTNITFLQAGLGEGKLQKNIYDRAILVTVLGEIPNQAAALAEIFAALKPGGILSITEIIFDPHFQTRSTVTQLSIQAGFKIKEFFGNRIAYTLILEK